jgi:hypothetical protein
MGQVLSLCMVLAGLFFLVRGVRAGPAEEAAPDADSAKDASDAPAADPVDPPS